MAEYIDREKFRKHIQDLTNDPNCPIYIAVTVEQYIDAETAADVVPVVHAEWVKRSFVSSDVFCSECHTLETTRDSNYKSKYCPHCGAKMDGTEENGC